MIRQRALELLNIAVAGAFLILVKRRLKTDENIDQEYDYPDHYGSDPSSILAGV